METVARSRRTFLKAVVAASGALFFFWRYLTPRAAIPRTRLEVDAARVPPGGALVYPESGVAVIRNDTELYALDLTCTHLGCTVGVTPTELVCPCHGSRFDRTGQVVRGPADRPLRRLRIKENGRKLLVLA